MLSHLHLPAPSIQFSLLSFPAGGHMGLCRKEEMTLCLLFHKQIYCLCIHCKYLNTTLHIYCSRSLCNVYVPYGLSFGAICMLHNTSVGGRMPHQQRDWFPYDRRVHRKQNDQTFPRRVNASWPQFSSTIIDVQMETRYFLWEVSSIPEPLLFGLI